MSAHAWSPPPVTRIMLPNGFQIYLLEDHGLPLFQARLFVRVGDVHEPANRAGLVDLLAGAWVTGGTQSMEAEAFDEWLDQLSIHLAADAGRELTTLTVSSLAAQWQEALQVLGDVVLKPGWNRERFDLAKERFQESLRRDEDEPGTIAVRTFRKILYGEGHPWAHVPVPSSVGKVGLEEVQAFYQKYFQPDRMLLAVAGDFSSARVKKWVEQWIGRVQAKPVEVAPFVLLPFENRGEKKKIRKKVTQSFIEAGHLGIERFNKDQYAYGILQYILGGEPFISRLGNDIRSEAGLAYSVYSDWDATPVRGYFRIHVETRSDAEEKVLQKIREHLERLSQKADITQGELNQAKEALLNKYIFWFDSPFDVVFMQARYDLLGFPHDYLQKYPSRMRAVTLGEIRAVAKKYFEPENLKIVVVGP